MDTHQVAACLQKKFIVGIHLWQLRPKDPTAHMVIGDSETMLKGMVLNIHNVSDRVVCNAEEVISFRCDISHKHRFWGNLINHTAYLKAGPKTCGNKLVLLYAICFNQLWYENHQNLFQDKCSQSKPKLKFNRNLCKAWWNFITTNLEQIPIKQSQRP